MRKRLKFTDWLSICEGSQVPEHMKDAMIYVHDTLDSADVIAQSIFGAGEFSDEDAAVDDATVLAVYDRLVGEHRRRVADSEEERGG
jgi:hypothetical protein